MTTLPSGAARGLAALADWALEATVVGGFSKLGYKARKRLFDWTDPPPGPARGERAIPATRVMLVTGGTSGLGAATAGALAAEGVRIWLVGRSPERAQAVADQIRSQHPGAELIPALADLAEPANVAALAARLSAEESRLDAVVHTAGAMADHLIRNSAGQELTTAVHLLAPFRLTAMLLPLLTATPGARVVTVTSGGMYLAALNQGALDDPAQPFNGVRVYANAKRAQVLLNLEWDARFHASTGVAFHAMHPGWADTPGVRASLPGFRRLLRPILRTAEQGADTAVWLAKADVPSGHLWSDRRMRPVALLPNTRTSAEARSQLWQWAVARTGIDPVLGGGPKEGAA